MVVSAATTAAAAAAAAAGLKLEELEETLLEAIRGY
jgi:hypothetical protein